MDGALSVAVQSDGRIIVAGWGRGFVTDASLAARLLSLDVSYGTQGPVGRWLARQGTIGSAVAFALTSNDKLAALGFRAYQSQVVTQPYLELLDHTSRLPVEDSSMPLFYSAT